MGLISRRRFVKMGAQGMLLAAVPVALQFDPTKAFAGPAQGEPVLSDYYKHFGVDETVIRRVLAAGLEKGGDYCDVYFQHTISNSIRLEDNIVSQAATNIDFGVGIRVLKGDQTGYSFTEEITPEAMALAAKTAANIAAAGKTVAPVELKLHNVKDNYPIQTGWEAIGVDGKIPLLQRINDKITSLDKRVVRSLVFFSDETSYVLFANSEGRVTCDYRPLTSVVGVCTAEQNGQRETGYYDYAIRDGIEFYTPQRLDYLASEAVRRTVLLFDAVKPQAGEMPVVLAAGSSGILMHEAMGHGMEADFNRKGESIFSDKIGKPVAESFVSIVDDGTLKSSAGSINVDDEGNDSQNTVLVENGILRSYMHDRISAKFYKVAPTGSGRRQSFRFAPIPRMRNTYMLPGPHKRDEIIASVKKGVLCDSFANGEVRIGPGDFTFYVKVGYLIEDGKLTAPIKDVNLIGNGPDALSKIVMVADDLEMSQGSWTCGKDGQGVSASMGLPTIKVSALTVGGVNG
jgi:TldD protein